MVHKRSYKINYSPLDGLHSFEALSKLALKIIFLSIFMRQQNYAKLCKAMQRYAKICKAFNDAYRISMCRIANFIIRYFEWRGRRRWSFWPSWLYPSTTGRATARSAARAPVEAARLLEASQPERLLLYNGQCWPRPRLLRVSWG